MTKKLAYIISNIDKAVAFEWIATAFREKGLEIRFILLNPGNSYLETFLVSNGFTVERVFYTGKRNFLSAVFKTRKILRGWQIDTVHAHLFDASLIGLFAARLNRIPKRIHTRHAGILHHKYHPHAVKYDKWINGLSTHIVSISQATSYILQEMEGAAQSKIRLIPHGFRIEEFSNLSEKRILAVRENCKIPANKKIIGVVSRYIEWKGLQYIIPAFQKQLEITPDIHLVLCGANGPFSPEVKNLLSQLKKDSYTEIAFEKDNAALYHCFDYCIHTPIDELSEAFGQVYIEAMASGIPMIVTLSGIATEYIAHEKNALVVPFRNVDAIQAALDRLLRHPDLGKVIAEQAREDVQLFTLEKMIQKLASLYDE